MAKPNFNYIRKLINTKMRQRTPDYCAIHEACRKETSKLFAAAVKKASKDTLVSIILKEKDAHETLKVQTSYALYEQRMAEVRAPYESLLSQLDSLELKAAMGSDPSEELKKIVAAIEKL